MIKKLIYNYLVYIIYFLGIGMVSSGIVLMPFNTVRYSIIMSAGLILFITGSIFNEVVINHHHLSAKESVKLVAVSLTLAIGIGMISGGISHFKESPVYVSYLIPIGIVVSCISFAIKNNYELSKNEKIILVVALVIIAVILHFALGMLANYLMPAAAPPGGDIFKPTPMPGH
jgi:4-amino-4-deoxy-L-arabinose transferase-like glycosyltransferase